MEQERPSKRQNASGSAPESPEESPKLSSAPNADSSNPDIETLQAELARSKDKVHDQVQSSQESKTSGNERDREHRHRLEEEEKRRAFELEREKLRIQDEHARHEREMEKVTSERHDRKERTEIIGDYVLRGLTITGGIVLFGLGWPVAGGILVGGALGWITRKQIKTAVANWLREKD